MSAVASRPIQPSASMPADTTSAADARLAALPKSARDKYERLRRAELRSRATVAGLLDEIERTREVVHDGQGELGRFDRRWPPQWTYKDLNDEFGGREKVPVEYPERLAILAQIAASKVELARLNAEAADTGLG